MRYTLVLLNFNPSIMSSSGEPFNTLVVRKFYVCLNSLIAQNWLAQIIIVKKCMIYNIQALSVVIRTTLKQFCVEKNLLELEF